MNNETVEFTVIKTVTMSAEEFVTTVTKTLKRIDDNGVSTILEQTHDRNVRKAHNYLIGIEDKEAA